MLTVTQFLNEKMDGILQMERDNEEMVHLFHVNDCWSAVEKSAYFLSQLVRAMWSRCWPRGMMTHRTDRSCWQACRTSGSMRRGRNIQWSGMGMTIRSFVSRIFPPITPSGTKRILSMTLKTRISRMISLFGVASKLLIFNYIKHFL